MEAGNSVCFFDKWNHMRSPCTKPLSCFSAEEPVSHCSTRLM